MATHLEGSSVWSGAICPLAVQQTTGQWWSPIDWAVVLRWIARVGNLNSRLAGVHIFASLSAQLAPLSAHFFAPLRPLGAPLCSSAAERGWRLQLDAKLHSIISNYLSPGNRPHCARAGPAASACGSSRLEEEWTHAQQRETKNGPQIGGIAKPVGQLAGQIDFAQMEPPARQAGYAFYLSRLLPHSLWPNSRPIHRLQLASVGKLSTAAH